MRYRKLGRSGLLVSELCLGTNMFGGRELEYWKDVGALDQKAVNAVVSTAVEGGVNFFDTADGYSSGESETLLGQSIKDLALDRSAVVICTKAGMQMGAGPNGAGASRAHLINACENSLRRLGTDYIDVYLQHMIDPVTPMDETLRAFDDLIRAGKIRYAGCSNFFAWELMKALGISEREGLARFEVVQSNWSIANRGLEREVVPMARSEGIGIMTWGALMSGVLSGKYSREGKSDDPGRFGGKIPSSFDAGKVHDIIDVMREIAAAHEVSPAEIALAFLLQEKATTSVIFGSTKPEQVKSNLRAGGLVLSDDEHKRLSDVSAPPPDPFMVTMGVTRSGRQQYV